MKRPSLREFRLELSLPWGVVGPVLFWALA